jgi:hypothetical protein
LCGWARNRVPDNNALQPALEGRKDVANPDVQLKTLLLEHGITSHSDGSRAWDAFKRFGRAQFGRDDVGLLFQVGVFTFSGAPEFYFDPVCQFETRDEDGEHDHFEQTHCELSCPVSDELRSVRRELWSFDFSSADAFYQAVEALPEFQVAVRQPRYRVNVYHERV